MNHNKENQQFVIQLDPKDDTVIAYLKYEFEIYNDYAKDTKIINLLSTVVPKDQEGKGIAKLLANAAFDQCQQDGVNQKHCPEQTKSHTKLYPSVISCWG